MKKWVFTFIVFAIATFIFFFFKKSENPGSPVAPPFLQNNIVLTRDSTMVNISSAGMTTRPHIEEQKQVINEKDLENLKAWDASRGHFSNDELDHYGRLSQNSLEELAKQGDLKAIQTLATNEVILGNSERGVELWSLAAVYGSTKALIWLSSGYGVEYVTSKKDSDALEALAYLNASAKRGDLFAKYRYIDAFYESKGFRPTEEQLRIIDFRSDEILNDLQKRRTEMGLPEFDNIPAPELQRIFDVLNKK